jgi:hypothetical protein
VTRARDAHLLRQRLELAVVDRDDRDVAGDGEDGDDRGAHSRSLAGRPRGVLPRRYDASARWSRRRADPRRRREGARIQVGNRREGSMLSGRFASGHNRAYIDLMKEGP